MPRLTDRIELGPVSPGTSRHLLVHRYGTRGTGPKVYLQASLHADEWPGAMAVHHLIPMLDAADAAGEIRGEIVVVPFANPVGFSQRLGGRVSGRYAFDGTGNFNRNWADLAQGAAERLHGQLTGDVAADVARVRAAFRDVVADRRAETEMDILRKHLMALSCDADYVLDLHCDTEATVHVYANSRHEATGRALCRDMDSPVLLLETTAGGGPFDEANAAPWWLLRGMLDEADHLPDACFAATVELRGENDVSDELGTKDAAGLISFLRREGVLAGEPAPRREDTFTAYLHETDVTHAPVAGLLSYTRGLGETVKSGDVLAVIVDPAAENPQDGRTEVRSRTDGILFARAAQRLIAPGETLTKVAGKTPLAHRKEGALLDA